MSSGKKVVLLNGDKGKWYDRAIFIVKDEKKSIVHPTENLVTEAEKIINDYYRDNNTQLNNSKKKERAKKAKPLQSMSLDMFLNICITVCSLFLLACICFIIIPI